MPETSTSARNKELSKCPGLFALDWSPMSVSQVLCVSHFSVQPGKNV